MNERRAAATLMLFVILSAAPARAEEKGVDDLNLIDLLNVEVSTASKTAESLDEAPAIITVVTREDIHRWGYRSVGEVLAQCVGFYVLDDHILPNAGVRGITGGLGAESSVIKVMIDGRSVAYRTTSGNWLGIELVPLESVKQIEIIRGPASALYGADAFLGVINIITLKPEELRPLSARGSVGLSGSHPGGSFDVVGGGQLGKFDLMMGAAGEYADRSGLPMPPESPAPTVPDYVGTRRTSNDLERRSLVLQGRLGYTVPRVGRLVLSAYASGLERGGDFAHWAQLTNGTDAQGREFGTIIALGQFRANVDGLLHATDTLDLALQSTYFRGGNLPADRVETGSDAFYVQRDDSYQGVDSVVEARWVPTARFSAVVGAEGVYDHESFGAPRRIDRNTGNPTITDAEAPGAVQANLVNVGSFVSINYKLFDPWIKLTGGIRYDRHNEYGGQAAGRFGITSRLSREVVAKLLYGSAFKAPSPYLLYAEPLGPGDVVGNRHLLPQHIHTLEYQLSWKPGRFFEASSGVSYSWLLDKAEFTPQGLNQTARNVASQRSLSWESRIDVRHYHDYTAYAAMEFVRSVRDLGQEGYTANLIGMANVVYPPWIIRSGFVVGVPRLPIDVGAQGRLVGPRRSADTSTIENGAPFTLPTYLMLDLSIGTRELYLAPGHESRITLRARNVLGTRGPDPGFSGFEYPLAPREVYLEFQHVY